MSHLFMPLCGGTLAPSRVKMRGCLVKIEKEGSGRCDAVLFVACTMPNGTKFLEQRVLVFGGVVGGGWGVYRVNIKYEYCGGKITELQKK